MTGIRILAAATAAALAITVALWWLRAWAQYNADEQAMATAMTARDNWDNDCN